MRRKIGVFRLSEPKEFTNHYETAAWYQTILVQPGDYDAVLLTDRYPWVIVRVSGPVLKSNFSSLWGGVQVGKGKYDEDKGEIRDHVMQYNPYLIAKYFLDKNPNWIPDPDIGYREVEFESVLEPGKMLTTTKLIVDGREYS